MKRLILSTVCMLFCTTGLWAQTLVDGIYYNFNESTQTASVTGQGSNKYSGDVTIPSTVIYDGTTYNVTRIGNEAFRDCIDLTSVTIPNSVTSIESGAFYGCSGLTSITIPNSVTAIVSSAFSNCSGLEAITVESGNTVYYSEGNCLIRRNTKRLILGCSNSIIPNDVMSIGSNAFSGRTGLTSVTIPNSVTSIGDYAFLDCTGLTSITIPNSVTSIGNYAFWNCTGLTSITIPNSVTSIGERAFSSCSGLTSVTIPNSVTSIGNYAFSNCTGLTSITIPNSVTSIGYDAFSGCGIPVYNAHIFAHLPENYSGKYSIPEGIETIVSDAFSGCTGLTSVTIPNSVTSIGGGAFDACTRLTSVTIPNSVTTIEGSAFNKCSALKNIEIPNSVTSIEDRAFSGCRGLTSVTIPNSVTSIGYDAFRNVRHIIYTGSATGSPWGAIALNGFVDGDFVFSDNTKTLLTAYIGDGGDVTIPSGVTTIGNSAFYNCSRLTSVEIPNSVTSIEDKAFRACKRLTSVTIGKSVATIGEKAFEQCVELKEIINESDLNITKGSADNGYVAYYADYVCNGGKTMIGDFIFSDRDKALVKYTGNGGDVTLPEDFNGDNYSISGAFSGCIGLTSVTIPNSVTSIGGGAFSGCSGLTSVTIPNSVTSIGGGAFSGCSGLTSITIPNSVTTIESSAFYGCKKLTSVTIGTDVTTIGERAFSECSGLTSINVASGNSVYDSRSNCNAIIETASNTLIAGCQNTIIPNSVTKIEKNAFYSCSGLTSITIPNSVTSIGSVAFYNVKHIIYTGNATGSPWGAISINGFIDGDFVFSDDTKTRLMAYIGNGGDITIPNSVTSIGDGAFYNSSGLTSVTIGDGVTEIGYEAFYNCEELTSIKIPNPVTTIREYTFYKCTGLTIVTLPNSVTTIESSAFSGCTGLTSITIPNSVTSIGNGAFSGCTGLTSVTIPNSVTTIGNSAFYNCSKLTSVEIPSSVASIGNGAFSNCKTLTSIDVAEGNANYTSIDGVLYGKDRKTLIGCPGGKTSITIPNSVTSIGNYAFENCSGLTNITIPNSVTSIGDGAFSGCTGLTSVTFGEGVIEIGYEAFYNCEELTSIIVPCEKYDYFVGMLTEYAAIIYENCTFEVAVNANNEDYGTVTGSGVFKMGQTIQLTATANEGYRFKGWSDGVMDASREITVTKDTSITANFVALYTIKALASASQGTVSGGGLYEIGETATLVANAKAGYTFAQWVDGSDENPRTVTVNGNKTYTAIFSIDKHNVTLNKNITAAGTVTGDGVYEHNTTVQLTATANEGYRFKGWSDGVTDASREIIATKDTIITANFVALYTIKALASVSQGTVIGGGVYEDGETVTLVANAKPGYVFAQWVDGSDENPRKVTVDGNKTYTAYFIEGEQDKYMITWKNWDGRVIKTSEVSYGEVPAFDGEKPTRPDEAGYTFTFSGWSPTIAAASQNAEYTANYIQTATEAEKTTIENEGDISITTTDNTALFTWPENASADTYTLTITRNDEVFCSLTFDGQGRLINLNFPNLRASAEGYQFTVTGLNSGTDYAYDLKAKNGAATVNEYTGEFRTSGDAATAAPEAEESIVETARYDINGRPLTTPTKGVNIVKYSDGSFEKEFVR